VDVGALSGVKETNGPIYGTPAPRVAAGVGFSWDTPFGLINIDLADPLLKYGGDKTQIFRFASGKPLFEQTRQRVRTSGHNNEND
jgi:outer membrane protein insertion porin family